MAANNDDDEKRYYGVDAEQAEKMKQKLEGDPEYIQKALEWVEMLTGEKVNDCYESLKSGIILCKLINAIKPDIIKTINVKPIAICQRENIRSYLRACESLGVMKAELFDISDLHEKRSLNAVILNIYALGRATQVLEGYTGPVLGVKYSVTIADQRKREELKEAARKRQQEEYEIYEQERKKRREFLEDEKASRRVTRQNTERENVKSRRIKKGRRISNSHRISGDYSNSPVKFGMDYEHEKMMEDRFLMGSNEHDEAALDWIEAMTGTELDEIYRSLKTGVVLCQLANAIQPKIIPKINNKNLPAMHRENIQMYLNACVKLGVPAHEIFTVPDVYERKLLPSVVVNIFALARIVQNRPNTPTLSKGGKPVITGAPPRLQPRDGSLRNFTGAANSNKNLATVGNRNSGHFSNKNLAGAASGSNRNFTNNTQQNNRNSGDFSKKNLAGNQSIRKIPNQESDSPTEPLLVRESPTTKEEKGGCCSCTIL